MEERRLRRIKKLEILSLPLTDDPETAYLRLLHDVPVPFFHVTVKNGGHGVYSLCMTFDVLQRRKLTSLSPNGQERLFPSTDTRDSVLSTPRFRARIIMKSTGAEDIHYIRGCKKAITQITFRS